MNSLCGLDISEELKVSHGELSGHLHGAELQQRDLALSEEVLGILVWAQCLSLHVVFQVVPMGKHTSEREVNQELGCFIWGRRQCIETNNVMQSNWLTSFAI